MFSSQFFKFIPMVKAAVFVCTLMLFSAVQAQHIDNIITVDRVSMIEKTLASDSMQGRETFTPGNARASAFIENGFKQTGLQYLQDLNSYRQEFSMTETKNTTAKITINGTVLPDSMVAVVSYAPEIVLTQNDLVDVVHLDSLDQLRQKIGEIFGSKKNQLVLVDSSLKKYSSRLARMGSIKSDSTPNTIVFVFGVTGAEQFMVSVKNTVTHKPLNNVVGILPGKTKPGEYVIFSGHYDHLGIGKPDKNNDSVYNGANDDASGTTAVIMLAKYFKAMNNNERTLVFVTFTAEEIGGYGSQYFSRQLDPAKVVAMFNIEMIGTESKWGTNSAYITGYEKTDMGKILEKNLQGSKFTFYPDPYPDQQLFYRSDNATLARQGVPAHAISTSKMDAEKYYHTQGDAFETLDMINMTEIIKAIAASSASIISGKDAPSRVDAGSLK